MLHVSPQTLNLLGSLRDGMALVALVYHAIASDFLKTTSTLIAGSLLMGYKVRVTLEFLIEEVVGMRFWKLQCIHLTTSIAIIICIS